MLLRPIVERPGAGLNTLEACRGQVVGPRMQIEVRALLDAVRIYARRFGRPVDGVRVVRGQSVADAELAHLALKPNEFVAAHLDALLGEPQLPDDLAAEPVGSEDGERADADAEIVQEGLRLQHRARRIPDPTLRLVRVDFDAGWYSFLRAE